MKWLALRHGILRSPRAHFAYFRPEWSKNSSRACLTRHSNIRSSKWHVGVTEFSPKAGTIYGSPGLPVRHSSATDCQSAQKPGWAQVIKTVGVSLFWPSYGLPTINQLPQIVAPGDTRMTYERMRFLRARIACTNTARMISRVRLLHDWPGTFRQKGCEHNNATRHLIS